ncbi:hypothetical protein Taro_046897 [Colocasia esculenta]|uniref:RNase H type-1 domain-containing protein n=1 Tax=Colocasia esculenta TaxID=4460 RepID=A0A843X7N7_COLES|nr:hypothetical protein [Colocasia esculenta]
MEWMDKGDRNFAFYQAFVKGNRRRNKVQRIQIDGTWSEDQQAIRKEAARFFGNLLQTTHSVDHALLDLSPKPVKLVHWIAPIAGFCLNVDGASKGNLGFCGGGGCIRDRYGKVLAAFCSYYGEGDSAIAETRALCDGLRLAHFLGAHISTVYSDSSTLVSSLQQNVLEDSSSTRLLPLGWLRSRKNRTRSLHLQLQKAMFILS